MIYVEGEKLDLFGLKDHPYCLQADIWCDI